MLGERLYEVVRSECRARGLDPDAQGLSGKITGMFLELDDEETFAAVMGAYHGMADPDGAVFGRTDGAAQAAAPRNPLRERFTEALDILRDTGNA